MTRIFPFMIVALFIAMAAPLAVDWVGGLTLDLANETATKMQEALD